MTEYIRFRALRTNPVSFSSRELQSDVGQWELVPSWRRR